jgi:nitroimidazol reductase NimA-like FMN-containing flavoprotein (pyridoxamine 5'-phosphate oxidase superfamily)
MAGKLSTSEREAFLAAQHVGIISVVAGVGKPPFAVPIWYGYEPGGAVTIWTGPSSLKARLIKAAGCFTLSTQEEALPYRYVTVSGPVVEMTDEVDPAERLAVVQRYLGEEQGRAFHAQETRSMQTIRMRPTTWRTFDFG